MELADEDDARRHDRVGQGLGRGVARRRLLLQPLSGAAPRAGEGLDQREPSGASSIGSAPPQSDDVLVYEDALNPQRFHTLADDRGRTLRDSHRSPSAAKARMATRSILRDLSSGRIGAFTPLVPAIATTRSASSTMLATNCWCRPTARRRTGAWSSIDPGAAGRGELDRRAGRASRAAAECQHGGRQAVRDLPEGRDDESLRLQARRHARERNRAARPGRRGRLRRHRTTTRSCSTRSTR